MNEILGTGSKASAYASKPKAAVNISILTESNSVPLSEISIIAGSEILITLAFSFQKNP